MRFIANCSHMLEETSRVDESSFGKCLNVMLYSTLADRFWSPFKTICFNPVIVLAVVAVVYVIFCVIFIPLLLISYLITSIGSLILFMVIINYLVQVLARAIAFPGCNVSVQKQLSSDFISRIISYLENVATVTADFTATLMLVDSGRLPTSEIQSSERRLDEIVKMAAGLPKLQLSLKSAIEALIQSKTVSSEEQQILTQLHQTLNNYNVALSNLASVPNDFFRPSRTAVRNGSEKSKNAQGLLAASQCLQACEALKIAASMSQPPKSASGDEDSGLVAKLKGLLSFTEGLRGSEKLTFPYMRELLKSRFDAQRLTIKGSTGNTIDAIVIKASAVMNGELRPRFAAATSGEQVTPSKGIVLFCSPNAGFYECVSQSELRQSWLGYYCVLGYDVCYYNYAGYGSSSGTPHPSAVKKDALLVALHLRKVFNPLALIVHGESIGGMAACYVASHSAVEGLVCDRTFASLDAVATRLLRGMWAGYGLRYLGLWQTHVVNDYLACSCPKLILQDPDDEIIANVASLKNGVATHMLLDDNTWYLHSEPHEYVLSSYLNEPGLPHAQQSELMLLELNDLSQALQESLVAHLYACILSVSKKSTKIGGNGRSGRKAAQSQQQQQLGGDSVSLPEAKVVGRTQAQQPQQQQGSSSLTQALQSTSQTIDMINAQGSILSHKEERLDAHKESGSMALDSQAEEQDMPQFSSQKEFLNYICNVSVTGAAASMSPFTKLWVVLARIDGGSGQLLGQAVRGGYDGFRAWLCSLLVWGTVGRAFPDKSLPASRTTLQRAVRELSALLEEPRNSELRLSVVVVFIRDALQGLARRLEAPIGVQQHQQRDHSSEAGNDSAAESLAPASSSSGSSSGAVISLCNLEANCGFNACCEQLPASAVTQRGGRRYSHLDSSVASSSGTISNSSDNKGSAEHAPLQRVGQVVPLHCGHNGWPVHHELAAITEFFVMNRLC